MVGERYEGDILGHQDGAKPVDDDFRDSKYHSVGSFSNREYYGTTYIDPIFVNTGLSVVRRWFGSRGY